MIYRGELREIPMTLYYPPDIQACIFWLRNRRRQTWHDKAEVSADGSVDLLALLDAAGERARRDRA